ncbi:Oidioi.mRNA.OKI2018_I69.XSR.g13469.t1.cds [Oikopleura dioica]|uniref:Oidioi.mRNA.OKI2018_I69.XSR.g13469.t1.cds n=1 Tax=Oikopleura dioica TaxID=34765 RepID=A0ABN7SDW8_OIKDI|nr:Oidioi.mRNA.OKI2018_I69.XSR.g13469.t1.cds [Oikopleura dioica]
MKSTKTKRQKINEREQEKQLLHGIISIALPISGVELILDRRLCEMQRKARDIKGQLLTVPIESSGKGIIHLAIELSNEEDLQFLLEFEPPLDQQHPWPIFSAFEGEAVNERLQKLFRLCKPKTHAEWYEGLKYSRLEGKEYLKAFWWVEQMKYYAEENEKVKAFVRPGCYTPDFGCNRERPRRVRVTDKIEVKEKQPKKLKSNSFSRRVWNGLVKMKERLLVVKKKRDSNEKENEENEQEDEGFGSFDRRDVRRRYVQKRSGSRRFRQIRKNTAANLWRVKSDSALESEPPSPPFPQSKTIPAELSEEINKIRKMSKSTSTYHLNQLSADEPESGPVSEFPMSMPNLHAEESEEGKLKLKRWDTTATLCELTITAV